MVEIRIGYHCARPHRANAYLCERRFAAWIQIKPRPCETKTENDSVAVGTVTGYGAALSPDPGLYREVLQLKVSGRSQNDRGPVSVENKRLAHFTNTVASVADQ